MSKIYNIDGTSITLRPEYVSVHRREEDEPTCLFNADEIIDSIASVGHPNASRLLKDFSQMLDEHLRINPRVSRSEAGMCVLQCIIEKAYGISYEGMELYCGEDEEVA